MTQPDKLYSTLDSVICTLADIAFGDDLDKIGMRNLAAKAYRELKAVAPMVQSNKESDNG